MRISLIAYSIALTACGTAASPALEMGVGGNGGAPGDLQRAASDASLDLATGGGAIDLAVADVPCPAAIDQWCQQTLAPGVIWRARSYASLYCGAQRVNVLDIDFGQANVSARPVAAQGGGYETVASMGQRTGAVAGINGGFFCNGTDDICSPSPPAPVCDATLCGGTDTASTVSCQKPAAFSLLQIGGASLATNCKVERSTLGFDANGRSPMIAKVMPGIPWASAANAIGAGPNLVSAPGVIDVTDEGFRWPCSQHARSAAALDDRGHLLLVTFDGKHGAAGVTLPQLADFLVSELHARQAMNLDGGGSTTLYVAGRGVVNVPSDDNGGPAPRLVYDGLFVYSQ